MAKHNLDTKEKLCLNKILPAKPEPKKLVNFISPSVNRISNWQCIVSLTNPTFPSEQQPFLLFDTQPWHVPKSGVNSSKCNKHEIYWLVEERGAQEIGNQLTSTLSCSPNNFPSIPSPNLTWSQRGVNARVLERSGQKGAWVRLERVNVEGVKGYL